MLRSVLVAALVLLNIALWAPDLPRVFGHPMGLAGFTITRSGSVADVIPGSPAERAGIKPGDRIDFQNTPLHSRLLIVSQRYQTLHPVQSFSMAFLTKHGPLKTVLRSMPESAADRATVLPRIVFELILLTAAIALVLLRPSKATWGFLIFACFNPAEPANQIAWLGAEPYQLVMATLIGPYGVPVLGSAGAIVFALYLLVPLPIAPWRRAVELCAYAIAALIVLGGAFSTASAVLYGKPLDAIEATAILVLIAENLAVPLLLAATYRSSDAATRERLRWVLFAFVVSAAVNILYIVTSQSFILLETPYWLWATTAGIDAFVLAFAISYAVLKHHVIDVNVVISRALVYTILSAIVVVAFTLVDLFFTRALSKASAGLIVDIGLALIIGFFFNTLHQRVDRFVDRVLFRKRHLAEEHMRTVIRALPFSSSYEQIDRLLSEEPVRSFALSGSTLLVADDDGNFVLRRSFGVSPPALTGASNEDALPIYLQGERAPLHLNHHGWHLPAIAVPLFSHGDLIGIAVYGLHENGTDFDGEEITLLEALATSGGIAYDRLEARQLREEVRDLRFGRQLT